MLSTTEVSNQIVDSKSQVVFLYKIIPYTGDVKSYGIWCASIAGITNPIIERGDIVLFSKSFIYTYALYSH